MPSHLYADLGNTTLHLGLWDDGWVLERRVPAAPGGEDSRHRALDSELRAAGLIDRDCAGALLVASTQRTDALEEAIGKIVGVRARVLGRDVTLDMPVAYDDPTTFGQDRLLAAFAAGELAGHPCIVLDAGTCLTCEAVSTDGVVLPVGIAPGLPILTRGLGDAASHLAESVARMTKTDWASQPPPARSTEEALAVGFASCLGGAAERLLDAAVSVLQHVEDAPVILTGGDATLVARLLPRPVRVEPMLCLEGLRLLDQAAAQ